MADWISVEDDLPEMKASKEFDDYYKSKNVFATNGKCIEITHVWKTGVNGKPEWATMIHGDITHWQHLPRLPERGD